MKYPILIKPACKDNLWGGNKLKKWNKGDTDIVAESWELSLHPAGVGEAVNGEYAGQGLDKILASNPDFLGDTAKNFEMFPVLIKFIDAAKPLSIQVHPSDAYALKNENQYGKTEVWYIMDSEPHAGIYCGFKQKISKDEYKKLIAEDRITDALNFIEVKPGDIFMIESGTVHAIGAGITICEIQQNSNVTYRVYDYGRKDAKGNLRELHIDKAVEVSNLEPKDFVQPEPLAIKDGYCTTIAECKYFKAYKYSINGEFSYKIPEFSAITILNGKGKISDFDIEFKAGETYFIPCDLQIKLVGEYEMILTTV